MGNVLGPRRAAAVLVHQSAEDPLDDLTPIDIGNTLGLLAW
jgi:hypothetical protein